MFLMKKLRTLQVCDSLTNTFIRFKRPVSSKRTVPVFTIAENDIEEIFARGSGPGGQSVNKTKNKVQLTHKSTGISVYCHEARNLTRNRKIARKLLTEKVDMIINGDKSVIAQRIRKLQVRKVRARQRALKKYNSADASKSLRDATTVDSIMSEDVSRGEDITTRNLELEAESDSYEIDDCENLSAYFDEKDH